MKSLRLGAITAAQFDWLAHRASEPFSGLFPAQALLARAVQQNATLITAGQRLLRKLQEPHPRPALQP